MGQLARDEHYVQTPQAEGLNQLTLLKKRTTDKQTVIKRREQWEKHTLRYFLNTYSWLRIL